MKYLAILAFVSAVCTIYVLTPSNLLDLTTARRTDDQPVASSTSLTQPMPSPVEIDPASLERLNLVLLKFGAPWCPPCRAIDGELKELEQSDFPVTVRKINVDDQPEMAQRYDVTSIPRLILLQDGKIAGDLVGFKTCSELQDWVKESATIGDLGEEDAPATPAVVHANPFFQ